MVTTSKTPQFAYFVGGSLQGLSRHTDVAKAAENILRSVPTHLRHHVSVDDLLAIPLHDSIDVGPLRLVHRAIRREF